MSLGHAIAASSKTTLDNAEVQRMTVEALLRNALQDDLPEDHRSRVQRLLHSIEAASTETPARKVALLLDVVAPTLENLQ